MGHSSSPEHAEKAATTPSPQFIGRSAERDHLQRACAAAALGHGSLTIVAGEPGIGKSTLCREVAGLASDSGLTAVLTRCYQDDEAPPLWLWHSILRELADNEVLDRWEGERRPAPTMYERSADFSHIVSHLRSAAARRPLCLIFDDADRADPEALMLLRFLSSSLVHVPLAIVVAKSDHRPTDNTVGQLLDDLQGDTVPLVLRRFDRSESLAFLASYGLTGDIVDTDLLAALVRIGGGHPARLAQIAVNGAPALDRVGGDGTHAVIAESVARLTPAARQILQASAVIGLAPSTVEAARVAAVDPVIALDATVEAEAAGLIVRTGDMTFSFGHELIRKAFDAGLTTAERLDAHGRAAEAVPIDGPSARPEERARHALAAASRSTDDSARAVAACRVAASLLLADAAYDRADSLLSAAVELHGYSALGPPPGSLLLEWAQAAYVSGRMCEARRRFGLAAEAATHEDDSVAFAEAALGFGGHWVNDYSGPVERAQTLRLLRLAADRLGVEHVSLRARLRVRLAAEDVFEGKPVGAVFDAISEARDTGDPLVVADALSVAHNALMSPEHAYDRLQLADELIQTATEAGTSVHALMGLLWRSIDLFLVGDRRAPRALQALREQAPAGGANHVQYLVETIDVMLLIRAGLLDEAEAAAHRCAERGQAVCKANVAGYLSAQLIVIRWLRGGAAGMTPLAETAANSPALNGIDFAFRATGAVAAAAAGHREHAVAMIDELSRQRLDDLPRSSTWMTGMAAIVELSALVDDRALARQAYELLKPYADRPVMASLAVLCLGSAERVLGTAALTLDNPELAVEHLERAVEANQRLANRPLVAITLAELSRATRRRGRRSDQATADQLLRQAIHMAEQMGMTAQAASWSARLTGGTAAGEASQLGAARRRADHATARPSGVSTRRSAAATPATTADPPSRTPGSAMTVHRAVLSQQGHGWLVALGERRAFVPDLLGVRYIALLLERPGRSVAVTAMVNLDAAVGGDRYDLLDEQARVAYSSRLRDLMEELAEAEANADIGRIEQARAEIDALEEQLETATGANGRSRYFANDAERARVSVRKAIKRALDVIADADPLIGRYLADTVSTGSWCCYTPVEKDP